MGPIRGHIAVGIVGVGATVIPHVGIRQCRSRAGIVVSGEGRDVPGPDLAEVFNKKPTREIPGSANKSLITHLLP